MSNRRGRCFRDAKKLARRRARQRAAIAALADAFPAVAKAMRRGQLDLSVLSERQKMALIAGYEAARARR